MVHRVMYLRVKVVEFKIHFIILNEKRLYPHGWSGGVPICRYYGATLCEADFEKTETDVDDIKFFVLHQANVRILELIAKRLKVDIDKFPMNLDRYGNTSSASIPILLDELNRNHLLERGDKIILSGFGGGLTWGAMLIEW